MLTLKSRLKGWITIGGSPGARGEHEGGTPVFIDDASGKIVAGPDALTGKPISEVDQGKRKPGEKPKPPKNRLGGKLGRTGDADGTTGLGESGEGAPEDRGGVAPEAGGSGDSVAGEAGAAEGQPDGGEAPQDVPSERRTKRLEAIGRLKAHAEYFRSSGKTDQADWLDQLRAHVKAVGVDEALAALGEELDSEGSPERVQYGGAFDELGETAEETQFVKDYLDSCGITPIQPGTVVDPSITSIWSLPLPDAIETPGGFIPADDFFENKLEEAKHLPGLESSEDIDKVVGRKVTQFTPEVVEALDEAYGKGKWIVKSYGEEAFAGFGIFFPQRVKQMQLNAKGDLASAKSELNERGYRLMKDGDRVVGVKREGKSFAIGSPEYSELPGKIQRLGKQASIASKVVGGALLPMSPEDSLRNEYGIELRRNAEGVPIGITNWTGRDLDFDDPIFKKIEEMEGGAAGHSIHRALESDEKKRKGEYPEPKFMVQPAFEAVGVTELDRAVGATWETAKEGRVHCVTRDGKAQIVPYATLLGRGDSLPAVLQSEQSRAMEKAVQEAIDQLPEAKRRGQVYAPDVMLTKEGWRVVELNPSEASGGSAWLGGNPFVIDAMVSSMVGREPRHVKFMRDILKGKDVEVPKLPSKSFRWGTRVKAIVNRLKAAGTCKLGQRADLTGCTPAGGGGGGRPAAKPEKLGRAYTVRYGSYRASYSLHTTKRIDGPSIPFPNYQQQDEHSCGFVAALTVSRYLDPSVSAGDVLRAVKSTVSSGVDRRSLVRALKDLGVDASYTEELTVPKLRAYVDRKVPVLLTVWLEDLETDHWVAVQGFSEDRIHLTNYRSMSIAEFRQEWYTPGLGLVCRRAEKKQLRQYTVKQVVAAGLAVVADDTGRVLMVQRPFGDRNGGKWEFPGGRIEGRELAASAAVREWCEEVGLPLPEVVGRVARWDSDNGKYAGFVVRTPSESSIDFSERDWFSDPDSELNAVAAWVHPSDFLQHNLRPELIGDIDQVMGKVAKWLLGRTVAKGLVNRLQKAAGTCKPGQTAAQTDCTPASGEGKPKPKTALPSGKLYVPDTEADYNGDGITDSARVGVPAFSVPPPPSVGLLPNLTKFERRVEGAFVDAFHSDPDGIADRFKALVAKSTKEGEPPTYGTDDAKALASVWSKPKNKDKRAVNRATLNLVLHQAANAIAKRAFLKQLDELNEGDQVMVTVGGCGAGKGFALKNVPQALELKYQSKAVWDSAGDQNATENPWIQQEAEKRGLKVSYVYVHADPETQWAHPERGVVKRAGDPDDGRMVDADVFADSYALGAKNHKAFYEKNKDNPNANFVFLENRGKPKRLDGVPKEALNIDRQKLAEFARKTVDEMDGVPPHVKHGATLGSRVWGSDRG